MGFPIEPHLEIIGADRVAIEPEDRHLEDSKKSGPSGFRVFWMFWGLGLNALGFRNTA